jgi:hypothetical protein
LSRRAHEIAPAFAQKACKGPGDDNVKNGRSIPQDDNIGILFPEMEQPAASFEANGWLGQEKRTTIQT